MATGNMKYGANNDAGNAETTLASTAAATTLEITDAGQGSAIVAQASGQGDGVAGRNTSSDARHAGNGVTGTSTHAAGVAGASTNAEGVSGSSASGDGVFGTTTGGAGVAGSTFSRWEPGVRGSNFASLDEGEAPFQPGVTGYSFEGLGVLGQTFSPNGVGVFGSSLQADEGLAGLFDGNVNVDDGDLWVGSDLSVNGHTTFYDTIKAPFGFGDTTFEGDVTVQGKVVAGILIAPLKLFRIDDPRDPANRYLHHFSVESSELKTVYDGVVVLDRSGEAVIELPDWFEAVNGDFRYQLTPIGAPAPDLHIADTISNRKFRIRGGREGMEVCWQVTGVRRDRVAQSNHLAVEEEKPAGERGYYLHPELYGEPKERGIAWARDRERRRRAEDQRQPNEELRRLLERHRREKVERKAQLEHQRQRAQERQAMHRP
jgi:hypothetical protein